MKKAQVVLSYGTALADTGSDGSIIGREFARLRDLLLKKIPGLFECAVGLYHVVVNYYPERITQEALMTQIRHCLQEERVASKDKHDGVFLFPFLDPESPILLHKVED